MTSEYRAGTRIGNYILDSYIGGGGFGVVWRAHAVDGTQPVAIKILTGSSTEGTNGTSSALRADIEVLAATAGARSEHVVKVLGGGTDPNPYIVMEYIEGNDLLSLLSSQGHLDVPRTLEVGVAIADALRVLSDAGIIHRDIKPANVMIDRNNVIKLADFGIAKIMGYETLTMTGQTAMTMAYAAPEVWDDSGRFGKPSTKLDLYALGVVLYQCLMGNLPFTGNFGSLYRQHTEVTANLRVLPEDTPASLRTLIQRCLEKRQEDRPRDAAECLSFLQRAEAELVTASKKEPTHFGAWVIDAPHEQVAWAWRCHHEVRGDRATVEVHFTNDLELASTLRKAILANRTLTQFGAEKLIETSRLLLHPDEAWHEPPPGRFQFWVAREDLPVPQAPSLSEATLRTAIEAIAKLLDAADREGVALDFGSGNLTVRQDGSIYLRRAGLVAATGGSEASILAALRGASLTEGALGLLNGARSFPALVALVQGPPAADSQATVMMQRRRPEPPSDATVVRDSDATIVGVPRDSDATVVRRPSAPPPANTPNSTPTARPQNPPQNPPQGRRTPAADPSQQPVVARRLPPQSPTPQPPAAPPASNARTQSAVPPPSARAPAAAPPSGGRSQTASPPMRPPIQPPAAPPRKKGTPWWMMLFLFLFGVSGVAAAAFFVVYKGDVDKLKDDVRKLPGLAQATPTVVIGTPTVVASDPGATPVAAGGASGRRAQFIDALLFDSDRDGHEEIYIMNTDGTDQRRLTNTPKSSNLPDASPDSNRVVFVSGRDTDGGSEIYEMKPDGALPSHIVTVDGTKLEPNVSPDGKKIVFEVKRGDNYDVFTADIDGKNAVNLTNSPTADIDPVWSPDGKRIVFGSSRDGNMDIWVMNANGAGAHRLTDSPGFNGEPDWSPDGKKIVFESDRRGNFDLYVMNEDGSNVVRLGDDPGDEFDPAWSPDGKLIAYTSHRGPANEVLVINADGTGTPKNLSNNAANDGKPAWVKVRKAP